MLDNLLCLIAKICYIAVVIAGTAVVLVVASYLIGSLIVALVGR